MRTFHSVCVYLHIGLIVVSYKIGILNEGGSDQSRQRIPNRFGQSRQQTSKKFQFKLTFFVQVSWMFGLLRLHRAVSPSCQAAFHTTFMPSGRSSNSVSVGDRLPPSVEPNSTLFSSGNDVTGSLPFKIKSRWRLSFLLFLC